ncbi:MAG: hypothetical protein ACJAQ3_003307, partial [Planctomycetota bacterium]
MVQESAGEIENTLSELCHVRAMGGCEALSTPSDQGVRSVEHMDGQGADLPAGGVGLTGMASAQAPTSLGGKRGAGLVRGAVRWRATRRVDRWGGLAAGRANPER